MRDEAAFVSAGGYPHHIGLNTWESRGGTPPQRRGYTGLYHVAFRYPDRKTLAEVLRRLVGAGMGRVLVLSASGVRTLLRDVQSIQDKVLAALTARLSDD